MKIAVWNNLMSGGAKRALYYHIRGLVQRGHHVEIWCPDSAHVDFLPLSEFAREHVLPLQEQYQKIIQGEKRWDFHWMRKRLDTMKRHCRECAEQINGKHFDILFVNSCCYFYMAHIGPFIDIPKVIYLGEPYRYLYEAFPTFPWMAPETPKRLSKEAFKRRFDDIRKIHGYRLQAREEYNSAKSYDTILVNSLFSRESVLRAYGLDSKVCYLGIDMDLFREIPRQGDNYVVGVGYLYHAKGVDRAIKSIATIEKAHRPTLVWIANGYTPGYDKEMQALAESLQVDFSMQFNVSDAQLVELIGKAAVMIYIPRLEPFGFVPLEANACGTPVVGIAEGGIRETVRHGVNGLLVNDNDPQAIGHYIRRLIDDHDLNKRFRVQARKHVLDHWKLDDAMDNLEKHLLNASRQ